MIRIAISVEAFEAICAKRLGIASGRKRDWLNRKRYSAEE